MSWRRVRGVLVDVVLIGAAISYASDLVSAWLIAHETALCVVLGMLHMLMLPTLAFSRFFHHAKDLNRPTPIERLFVWCVVLYGGMGFIIPAIVGLTVEIPNQAFYMSTIFGPFVLTGLLIVLVIRFANERFGRIDAKPPRGFQTFFVTLCWAYLLAMEAMLMVAARGTGIFSGAGTILAAFVGYLPIRLVLVLDDEMPPLELASFAIGFCHFLYRLASAGS